MYTVVQKPDIPGHRGKGDRPSLEVIDHRTKYKDSGVYKESYDTLRRQREALQDAEIRYQKRIRELEKEAADYAKAQEATNTENKSLKNFIDRGPKAANIKRAKQENGKLQVAIQKLHEENKDLVMLINRMERRDEEEWRDVFEETRMRQEQRYSVVGPFVAGLNGKKTTITLNDIPTNKGTDSYDKQLERLSKQAKTLYNKFEQMKRVKGSIDYATIMGNKMWTQNVHKHRAIADRVNIDLNKYSARLQELTSKHEKVTEALVTSLSTSSTSKKKSKNNNSAAKANEMNGSGQAFMTEIPDIEKKGLVTKDEEYSDTESRLRSNGRRIPNKVNLNSPCRNKPEIKSRPETESKKDATLQLDDDEYTERENQWNNLSKSERKESSPKKTYMKRKPDKYNKDQNKYDADHLKSASSSNSRGILKGQENVKKDESVKFPDGIGTNGEYDMHTVTGSIEETWDQQREKMKESQVAASRRRPKSKSASTSRRKSVDIVKIKSDLGHYKDDNLDGMPVISRERKAKDTVYSDRTEYKTNRVRTRSPLVNGNALKEASRNIGTNNIPSTKIDFIDDMPISTRRKRKVNNYITGEPSSFTGRYNNGPEPTTETKRLLGSLEGPDPKQKISRATVDRDAKYRTGQDRKLSDTYTDALALGKSTIVPGKYNRQESKGNVSAKHLNSRLDTASAKSPRTFPKHPPISKDSIYLERTPNSKAVLQYLTHNTGGSPVDFNERFVDKEDHMSPLPVTFRDDARTLRQRNVRFVNRGDQMRTEVNQRRGEFYRSYLRDS